VSFGEIFLFDADLGFGITAFGALFPAVVDGAAFVGKAVEAFLALAFGTFFIFAGEVGFGRRTGGALAAFTMFVGFAIAVIVAENHAGAGLTLDAGVGPVLEDPLAVLVFGATSTTDKVVADLSFFAVFFGVEALDAFVAVFVAGLLLRLILAVFIRLAPLLGSPIGAGREGACKEQDQHKGSTQRK